MHTSNPTTIKLITETSVLGTLRNMLPPRPVSLSEGVALAEAIAQRLLDLRGACFFPVLSDLIADLPHIMIEPDFKLPHAVSGSSEWDPAYRRWVISVNGFEPQTRQRLTALHEFWHIVTHYHPGLRGRLPQRIYGLTPDEYLADYFAGCVLMPKRWVQKAYYEGVQQAAELADLFDVSGRAMSVRLSQLGLTPQNVRHLRSPRPSRSHTQPTHCIPELATEVSHEHAG